MNKVVISNRIYLNYTPELLDILKKKLTYKIERKIVTRGGPRVGVEVLRSYKLLPKNVISIPQGRTDLIPTGSEILDKRISIDMPFPEPKLQLREGQLEIYNKVNSSCFINAKVGWGKTFVALHIAKKLGQKTLIVTHTTILRDQWVKEIKKLFDMEPGIIGSGVYDIDSSIVVGNIQSIIKYIPELSKEFGTLIVDEAHHVPATTFTEVVDVMYAKYKIGLSGTMNRKDGRHILLTDYFSNIVFKPEKSNTINPTVKLINSGIKLSGSVWAKKINNLLYDEEYQNYISVIAATQMSLGHSVLIIADRVEFLTNVKEHLGEKCVLVTGATSFEERERVAERIETGEITCIAGSRQIFSEGISMNRLSCAILATPIAGVELLEQIIGRIMRTHPKKLDPVVIDIQFAGYTDKKQNNSRIGFYLNQGWEIASL